MRTIDTSFIRHLSDSAALAAAAFVLAAAAGPAGAAYVLNPTLPGQFAAGSGANATFLSIDSGWRETSVYWNERAKQYKNFPQGQNGNGGYERIGTFDWGTGIWGLADWQAINNAHSVPIVHSWTGVVPTISQGDAEWFECAKPGGNCAKWGAVGALPPEFFGEGKAEQNNWTSHYTGYIRITEPGEYNFGVLYDDGFFLNIWGANGSSVSISSDFLSPRERLGFGEDLYLTPGLYGFELGAYDRLEVGVVNLAWWLNGKWSTVPTENLVTNPLAMPAPPIAVPTPGTAALLVAGLGALVAARMRRKRG